MKTTLQPSSLLAGLSPADFMRRHWHKKPLLIRQALPGLRAPLTRDALFALAARDDVQARLVTHFRQRWHMAHGPFEQGMLPSPRTRQWTLLVQGVDLHDAQARALLERFRFVPDARLDDLMISYATDGGGVGPHVDSYDVFLLQVHGKRRWRIAARPDPTLVPDLPLKILAHFSPEQEWVLEPGDMLYLPPGYAHDGVAQGECMTCSIGFRAPTARETLQNFLYYLAENVDTLPLGRAFDGRYADPDQPATDRPGQMPDLMLARIARQLAGMHWNDATIARFLGAWLSEPKSTVFFEPPSRPLAAAAFIRRAGERGIALDPKSRLLYRGARLYINGESEGIPVNARQAFHRLADHRSLTAQTCKKLTDGWEILYDWYCAGWLILPAPSRRPSPTSIPDGAM